jgi:hypothetical protein
MNEEQLYLIKQAAFARGFGKAANILKLVGSAKHPLRGVRDIYPGDAKFMDKLLGNTKRELSRSLDEVDLRQLNTQAGLDRRMADLSFFQKLLMPEKFNKSVAPAAAANRRLLKSQKIYADAIAEAKRDAFATQLTTGGVGLGTFVLGKALVNKRKELKNREA